MMDIHILQAVLKFSSLCRCVVSCTLPSWYSNLAEMSFHIPAGDSWTVYGNFGSNSSSVMCYQGNSSHLARIFFVIVIVLAGVAMVTQHEFKVHSVWHLWMCLFMMEFLSVLLCWYPYSYDWSKLCTIRVMWAL